MSPTRKQSELKQIKSRSFTGNSSRATRARKLLAAAIVPMAGLLSSQVANANVGYTWEPVNNTLGGTGNWNGAGKSWLNSGAFSTGTSINGATNDVYFSGTAGTITLKSAHTQGNAYFTVSNYVLTTDASNEVLTTNISLSSSVNLNLFASTANAASGNEFTLIGGISGASGSQVTIQGTPGNGAYDQVDLSGGSTVSVPIVISGSDTTGTGYIGIVAKGTSATTTISNTITNNSAHDATELGATSGNTLSISGAISGSQGVLLASTGSGGAGTVIFGASNSYNGSTTINMSSAGTLQLQAAGALPSNSLIVTSGILDLDGQSVSVPSLSGASTGAIINSNGSTASTLVLTGLSSNTVPFSIGSTGAGTVNLTINQSSGSTTLTASNGYTGATTVSAGVLTLSGSGQINSTSGITINGSSSTSAKFVQLATTAVSPIVTLTKGTIDGTGTINTVNVGAGGNTIIQAGNGQAGMLTIGNLGFAGAANFTLASNESVAVTSLLSFGGAVSLNASATSWTSGSYTLITYGSVSNLSDVSSGSLNVSGLSSRQSATLQTGTAGVISFNVQGDSPEWTGATNGTWDTSTTNWKLITQGTATTYINTPGSADGVLFNDAGLAGGAPTTITFAGNVNPSAVTFNNSSNNYTLAASPSGYGITGGTSLVKAGSATLTINNTNSYTGGTILSGGTILLGATNALPTSSDVLTFANPGVTIDLASKSQTLSEISDTSSNTGSIILGGGTLTLGGDNVNTTLYSAISDTGGSVSSPAAGSLIKTGTGTLTLATAESYGGSTIISAGTVALLASAGSLSSTSNLVINGGKFQLNGNAQTIAELSGTSGTMSINSAGATLTVGDSNNTTFAGSVSGSGGLVKNGNGTLNLTGAVSYGSTNSYGGTTVNNGTLNLAGTGFYTGSTTVNSGGTLEFSENVTGPTTFSGASTSVAAGGNLLLAPAGTGAIIITNGGSAFAGNIVLGTATTLYSQATSSTTTNIGGGGQIVVDATGSLIGNTSGSIQGGVIANNIVLNGNNISGGAGSVANGGGYTAGNFVTNLGATGATAGISITGNISGNADVTISNTLGSAGGAGTLILGGSNTYTGATLIDIKGGIIKLASPYALPSTTDVVVGNLTGVTTPTLDLNGNNTQINSLSDGANLSTGVLSITSNGSNASLTISGSTTPANGSGATLKDGTGGTLALIKGGSSTLVLTNANNTYSGGTTINGGTIRANGSTSALGTGAIAVNTTATLGGSGTINNGSNAISVNNGGTITAGASASANGILTTGAQSWQGGGNYLWKISSVGTGGVAAGSGSSGSNGVTAGSGTPGTSWDQLTLTNLDISNAGQTSSFTLKPTGTLTSVANGQYSWIIAQASVVNFPAGITYGTDLLTTVPTGGTANAFALDTGSLSINGSSPTGTFDLSFQNIGGNEDLVLDYSATPEPGTIMLVLGGAAPMLMGRRRRAKNRVN